MPEARPTTHDAEPATCPIPERRHLVRVVISGAVIIVAAAGVIAQMDHDALLDWILRVSAIVAAMVLYQEIRLARQMDRMRAESRRQLEQMDRMRAESRRQLDQMDRMRAESQRQLEQITTRIEARMSRPEYWKIYSDVLTDLSGIDGETSTDSGHLPPRP